MELIIGGAFQGKLEYAKSLYPEIRWIEGETCSCQELEHGAGVNHFERYIRKMLRDNGDVSELAADLIKKNPDVVLISEEVGYGVVPVDAFERRYREAVGRVCTELAAFSKKVHRVVCGVGMVIKNDEVLPDSAL